MASASAMTEPRTLEEMHARYRTAQANNAAAAQRLEEQRRAREAEQKAAEERQAAQPSPTPRERFQARQKAALDARVFSVLDPDKLAREPKRIIARVAAGHDVSVAEILGPRRTKPVLTARHQAIVEVSAARPDLSLLTLGRIFNRDHTTILHALRRAGMRSAAASVAAPEARQPAEIIRSVAEMHGVTSDAIMGDRHAATVIVARAAAIAAVSAEHPMLSTAELASLFGRYRRVILKALRQHGLRPPVSSPAHRGGEPVTGRSLPVGDHLSKGQGGKIRARP